MKNKILILGILMGFVVVVIAITKAWSSARIDFYGVVHDQKGIPLVGAKIQWQTTRGPYSGTEYEKGIVETNKEGIFNITTVRPQFLFTGLMIGNLKHPEVSDVIYPNKKNHRNTYNANGCLEYGYTYYKASPGYFEKETPYKISVWRTKKIVNVMHGDMGNRGLAPNGELYTLVRKHKNKISLKQGFDAYGYLLLSCNREPRDHESIGGDWNATLESINGGIQPTNDIFLNLAPTNNYQPSISINMKKGDSNYSTRLTHQTFYFFSDNRKVYGSLVITFEPYWKEDYCIFSIKYKINTNSSKNLAVRDWCNPYPANEGPYL